MKVQQFVFGKWVNTVIHSDDQYVIKRADECRKNRQTNSIKYPAVRLIDNQNQIVWSEE